MKEGFFMNSGGAVWNDNGDTATVCDRENKMVATYAY